MRRAFIGSVLALVATALAAEDVGTLQGRTVRLKVDMPGDDSGLDVVSGQMNIETQRARLAKYGAALRAGQRVAITLVKVKGDHVEVQLGGGGFTNRQFLGLPGFDSVHWGMSAEEKRIRRDISSTRDAARKRRLESDYDRARRRRVQPLRDKLEREERMRFGSRFNVRFANSKEASAIGAETMVNILHPYVDWN